MLVFESTVISSTLFQVLFAVPQRSLLRTLLFHVFIYDSCSSIKLSRYCICYHIKIFKIFHITTSATDCTRDSTRRWRAASLWILTLTKLKSLPTQVKFSHLRINTKCVKNVQIAPSPSETLEYFRILNSIFIPMSTTYFLSHSKCWITLPFIYLFYTNDLLLLLLLYHILFRPELEYTSPVWNNIKTACVNKVKSI
jgi:hypothetical protein